MTVEEGRAPVQRERRPWKLLVAAQNVVVVACLLVTVWLYWKVEKERVSDDNVHIRFSPISDISGNVTLQFHRTYSMNKMSLADERNQTININCSGPYILYADVCYKSLNHNNSTGVLQLQVEGSNAPLISFTLKSSGQKEVCRGLHNTTYLRVKERASLRLYAEKVFKIKSATIGLSYQLGTAKQCYY